MRRTLTIIAAIAVLGGIFSSAWFLTGNPTTTETTGATSIPGDADASDSTTSVPDGAASPTTTALTSTIGLRRAANFPDLARDIVVLTGTSGLDTLTAGRLMAYTVATYHDSYRDNSIAPLIADLPGGAKETDALAAAAIVFAELSGNDRFKNDVAGWRAELGPNTEAIVAAVLTRADTDGYAAALDVKAPTFDKQPAWKPGGQRSPEGLLPGFGQVAPILLDTAACPVPAAPRQAITGEQAAVLVDLAGVEIDPFAPDVSVGSGGTGGVIPGTTIVFHTYLEVNPDFLANKPLSPAMSAALRAIVVTYDATIAVWKAKWENGVAAPLDLAADANKTTSWYTPAPSYPSLPATLVTFLAGLIESYDGTILNDERLAGLNESFTVRALITAKNARIVNWSADVAAGAELGRCLAAQALNAKVR